MTLVVERPQAPGIASGRRSVAQDPCRRGPWPAYSRSTRLDSAFGRSDMSSLKGGEEVSDGTTLRGRPVPVRASIESARGQSAAVRRIRTLGRDECVELCTEILADEPLDVSDE